MDPKQFARTFIEQDDLEWGIVNSAHFTVREFLQAMAEIDKLRLASRMKRHLYMCTFTIDPKKHPIIDQALEDKIEKLIKSQPMRPGLQCCEATMVKEHHKDGRPHWHLKLLVNKAIRSDAFQQYTKVYGSVDISRTKTYKSEADALHVDIYMSKEGEVQSLKTALSKDSC